MRTLLEGGYDDTPDGEYTLALEDDVRALAHRLLNKFGKLYSEFTIGAWDGPYKMPDRTISNKETFVEMILQYGVFEVVYDDNSIIIYGHHHDGTNIHRIRGCVDDKPVDITEDDL